MNAYTDKLEQMPRGTTPQDFDFFFTGYTPQHAAKQRGIGWGDDDTLIGPGVAFTGCRDFDYGQAQPRPWLIRWIKSHMIAVPHDRIGFEVVIRDDGSALLVVKYGTILGSRWAGFVKPETLPA